MLVRLSGNCTDGGRLGNCFALICVRTSHRNNNNTERSMGAARNKTTLIIINNLACCMCVCYGMHNEFVWRITPSFFGESARALELDII